MMEMKINYLFQNKHCANADQSAKDILKKNLKTLRTKEESIRKQSEEIVILTNESTDLELRITEQ